MGFWCVVQRSGMRYWLDWASTGRIFLLHKDIDAPRQIYQELNKLLQRQTVSDNHCKVNCLFYSNPISKSSQSLYQFVSNLGLYSYTQSEQLLFVIHYTIQSLALVLTSNKNVWIEKYFYSIITVPSCPFDSFNIHFNDLCMCVCI